VTDAVPEPGAARTRRRRQISVRRRPWLAAGIGVLGVGAAVAVPLLAVEATHTLSDSTAGEIAAPTPVDRLPDTPAALVAAVDENGEIASLAVFAGAPSGQGGTVILVPAGSAVTAPGVATRVRLGSRYTASDGGEEELIRGVEELLGITLSESVVLDEAGLVELLEPYGPFRTTLPATVSDSVRGGPAEPVFEAGTHELSAQDAARVLTAAPAAESEVIRYPAVESVWKAVAAAVGDGIGAPGSKEDDAVGHVRRVFAGPARVRAVGAVPVFDLAANPDELDLLEVDAGEVLQLVARVLPGAASPVSSGLRVKLVDATGRGGAISDAVTFLTYFGVAIIWIDDAPEQAETVVSYRSPDDVELFEELESVFGEARLVPADRPIEGVDATIVLGEAFPEFPGEDVPITVDAETTVAGSPATFTLQPDTTDTTENGDDDG
jgi:hypothetical protein